MQPHAFLPAEFADNERLRCGQGILKPMSLAAWVERDPFNKEADFSSANIIPTNDDIFVTIRPNTFEIPTPISDKPIAGSLDFDAEVPVFVSSRPKPTTTTIKTKTTVDNRIDFSTSTTSKPKKKRTTATTRRPSPTIIDNKIDFGESSTTKKPESPFSKLGKDATNSTLPSKRSVSKKSKRPKTPSELRSDDLTESDTTLNKKPFTNSDNATKYLNNLAITSRRDEPEIENLESRSNDPEARHEVYLTTRNYDNDFDYKDQPNRPYYDYNSRPSSFYPVYQPFTQPDISKRPMTFQNNRPDYQGSFNKRQPTRPTDSPISNKIQSTPFSYDSYIQAGSIGSIAPQINYDNMAIPLYISPNRVSNKPIYHNAYRPTYATTRKMELSTFFIIETTRRPVTLPNIFDLRRTTQRPNLDLDYHISYSTPASAIFISPSISDPNNPINLSYLVSSSNTNQISIKKPMHENSKPFSDSRPQSVFSHDTFDTPQDDSFDGYLRPETSFYIPIKNKHKPTYNDYSKYNLKPETSTPNNVRFVYLENVLHKYYQGKSNDEDGEGLYDQTQTKRYAEIYDKHMTDKKTDDFITLTRPSTGENTDNKNLTDDETTTDVEKTLDFDVTDDNETEYYDDETVTLDGRSKNGQENIFLVPFKVLTKIERQDNWVNKDIPDENTKSKLPEVPTLEQTENVARELPKPIFGRRKSGKT